MATGFLSDIIAPRAALGVSIGRGAVHGLRLVRSGDGFEVEGAVSASFSVERRPDPVEIAAALIGVVGTLRDDKTRLIAGIGPREAGLRFFKPPFSRPDKMARVLKYEAEPLFLTPVDDLVLDWTAMPSTGEGGRGGAVFGARPEDVSRLLGAFEPAGLDPDSVLPERLAAAAAGMEIFSGRPEPEDRLLIDLGAGQTGLAYFSDGVPVIVRSIFQGGLKITGALAEALEIDLVEAERIKQETDFSDPGDERIAGAIDEAFGPILTEIERTLLVAAPMEDDRPLRIVLAGGGALALNVDRYIADRTGLEVQTVTDRPPGDARPPGLHPEFTAAFGLARLGLSRGRLPNLRQGDLAPARMLVRHRKAIGFLAAGLVLVLMLSLGRLIYEYRVQADRYYTVKKSIEEVYRRAVPDAQIVTEPLLQMRQKVDAAGATAGAETRGKGYVLDLLLDVSRVTGAHEGLRITDLSLTPQRMELTGEGGGFEVIDQLKNELSRLPWFSAVTVGGARVDPNTKILNFKISLKRTIE